MGRGPLGPMTDSPAIIGKRLKTLRIALGFKTQTAFAAKMGLTKSVYNPWEKGTRPLTFEGALLIKRHFKIPLDYLFFGETEGLTLGIIRKIAEAA